MDFAKLKKNRKNKSHLTDLQTKMADTASGKRKNYKDDRFWEPTRDAQGNGYAVIRFLPSKGSDTPYERLFSYGFKNMKNKQWYIENSLTTFELPDPVAEYNSALYAKGMEDEARKQKRKLQFVSNVLIVKDQSNPENEGKVFLYKYGKKIFDKLNSQMNPEFEDEEAMDPYDPWTGANFRLKIRKVDGWPNYDKSDFAEAAPIAKTDDEIEEFYNQTYNLKEVFDPKDSMFKTYDELKKRMDIVLALESVDLDAPNQDVEDEPEQTKTREPKAQKSKASGDEIPFDPDPVEGDSNIDDILAELED